MEAPSSPLAGSSLQHTALLSKRWTNYASFSFLSPPVLTVISLLVHVKGIES